MADQVITKQELIDAQKDAQTLEDAVNGEPGKLIKSRTGREFYSLASVPQINTMTREEVAAAVTPKANKVDVDTALSNLSTTANKYYSTLAAANADIANIALNQSVTIGEEANSGLWEKKITGATSLTKSPYDPLMQAKNLVDALKSASDLEDSKLNTGITNLRNDFDSIAQKTANLYNNQNLINHPNAGFFLSDFIAVESGQRYKKTRTDGVKDDVHHVQAFDANKQPVVVENGFSYWQNAAWHTTGIVIPENVTFVRVVVNSSTKDILMFTRFDVDTSSYIPYVRLGDDLLKLLKNETGNEAVSVTHHHNVDLIGSIEYQLFDTDYAHLISYGQSLSTGNEADRAITTTAVARTYMIGDRVWIDNGNNGANVLNPLVASLYGQNGEAPIVSASQVFRKLLDKHHPHNSVDLIGTSCGYSGRSIEELSKESTNGTNHYTQNFITALNRAKSIADANSKTISCPALIWMQGEYNYTSRTGRGLTIGSDATNNKETYKSLLMILKNNMQADVMSIYGQTKNPLFFMYQVAGGYINLDNMPINMAMIEFEAENDDVIFMNPTYPVPDYGGGHLSANGYRWYGEYIAKQLSASLFQHKSSVVTQMRDVKVFGKKILIECQVPNPPLVIDTFTTQAVASNGFKVWDESGTLTILSVKIINGIAIELTLNRELGTNPAISYAGKDRSGSGNVRDSDRYASGLIYESDDGFRAPTYMPKDAKNVILDGKKLPMQNWLVAFYKELTQAS